MKKLFIRIICFLLLINFFLKTREIKAFVPYYYFPTIKNLKKESLSIGKNAYQLLYFGQFKESLNLAKLAVKINKSNEKLWLILAEAELANELYDDALMSLKKAQNINPNINEIYFAQSNIYLKKADLKNAKNVLKEGLKIAPLNHRAVFQLGNIFLMEKDYSSAIKMFYKAVEIKADFWQAINNLGLAYFEEDKIELAKKYFNKALLIEKNAETMLALASCLIIENKNSAVILAKEALTKNPNYVDFSYRKEQLWGEKIQNSIEKLFETDQLEKDINLAKTKINKTS